MQIEDVKQAPSRLNTAEIVAALMLHPGFANYVPWAVSTPATFCNGYNALNISAVAQKPIYTDWPLAHYNSAGREVVILGWNFSVIYDGAGAAADAGNFFTIYEQRNDINTNTAAICGMGEEVAVVEATRTLYSFSFPFWARRAVSFAAYSQGANRIWVPAGSEYAVALTKNGLGFPANTRFRWSAFGVSVPKGVCPPLCG